MHATTLHPDTAPHRLRPRLALIAATGLIIAALLATTIVAIVIDHARVADHTAQTAQNISHTLREHARRTFGELDRVLTNLASAVATITREGDPRFVDRALHHMSAGLIQAEAVLVADTRGAVTATTAPLPAATLAALADTLTRAPIDRLTLRYLGQGSGAPGQSVIMARPILADAGDLQGWTVAVLDRTYFNAFYRNIDLGTDGLIAVIHNQGPILFRAPELNGAIGTDVSGRPLFTRHLAAADEGIFRVRTGTDDQERIQAFATMDDVPLVVLVGVSTQHAYAAWERRSLILGGLGGLAMVVVAVMGVLLNRLVRNLQSSERRIRQTEVHLSRAQAIAHVGSWDWNLQTNTMWWSQELQRVYGLADTDEPPSYGRFLQAVHVEDRAAVAAAVGRALDDGQSFRIDYRVRQADGGERHVRHEGQCVLDSQGNVTRMDSVVHDTTDSTLLQARLSQAAKLSTLGEMAAGMAHELSQPLNILRMTAEGALLRDAAGDGQDHRSALQQVSDQADRMALIIDHIRVFSRKDTAPTQVFDARSPVRQAAKMMDPLLTDAGIRLDIDLLPTSAPVKGRPVQLEQVIVNLLANAKDSIMQRRADQRAADGSVAIGRVSLRMRRQGNVVEISLCDDGLGVPAGLFGRIFEPFFTTKQVGEGTGLGLSVSYGIITGMGGSLSAGNRLRGGAAFDISLPMQVAAIDSAQATAGTPSEEAVSLPHVLLVERAPATFSAARAHLTTLGYRISAATSGDPAWRRFLADPADIVITDLPLQHGDGETLVRRLREVDPFLPIVVSSPAAQAETGGGSDAQDPNTRVLAAPLSLDALDSALGILSRRSA